MSSVIKLISHERSALHAEFSLEKTAQRRCFANFVCHCEYNSYGKFAETFSVFIKSFYWKE